jgi:glycosyltransferase involved in cell wall biosynthesis
MDTTRNQDCHQLISWHVITCEYPPQCGGVSDYVHLVAKGLASHGDDVHVWCPASNGQAPQAVGVQVHASLGKFSILDLLAVGRRLDVFAGPRRLFVQWVPHGFGYKSLNLPFCLWLWLRAARHGDEVDLMVHEPFLRFIPGQWRQNAAAAVHRLMTRILLRSARRVWLSTPIWEKLLRPYDWNRTRKYEWLPVPSTVPTVDDTTGRATLRECYNGVKILLGHFGTFGPSITLMLRAIIPPLLRATRNAAMILIGPRSIDFRDQLLQDFPDLGGALFAIGQTDHPRLSLHLGACDLLIQPYPDGVTSRRTSMMAALAHGRPTVTTSGPFTESIWESSGAAILTPAGDTEAFVESARRLIENADARASLGAAGRACYQRNFDIEHVVEMLRSSGRSVEEVGV